MFFESPKSFPSKAIARRGLKYLSLETVVTYITAVGECANLTFIMGVSLGLATSVSLTTWEQQMSRQPFNLKGGEGERKGWGSGNVSVVVY